MTTALQRASALELDSLALPLLRVRRRLLDDMLVLTLAALAHYLSGPTSLRRLLLLVDEAEGPARLAVQRTAPLLAPLEQLGALRAHAHSLAEVTGLSEQRGEPRQGDIGRELLKPWVQQADLPGAQALQTELCYCLAMLREAEALLAALAPAGNRQVERPACNRWRVGGIREIAAQHAAGSQQHPEERTDAALRVRLQGVWRALREACADER